MLQTLLPIFTVAEPKSERTGYYGHSSSITLLPGVSHIINPPPFIAGNTKPSERLPYAKLTDYGDNWQASGFIHDFNNLLAIILSHTSIALSKLPADSSIRSNLDRAARATRRAADLSNQLSSNLSRNADEVAYAEPNAIIEEVAALLEPKIAAKADLQLLLDPKLFAVAVPRLRVQQIIMNLLLNAAEAIDAPPGQITVITANRYIENHEPMQVGQSELPTGHYSLIQVSDTGVGMNQEILNSIFDPYFTTKATGTGIGLSTTLGIVHAYQGIIQVHSTPGVSSTFRIFLPALED